MVCAVQVNGCTQVFSVVVNIFMAVGSAKQTTIRSDKVILVCLFAFVLVQRTYYAWSASGERFRRTYMYVDGNGNVCQHKNDRSKHKFTQMILLSIVFITHCTFVVGKQYREAAAPSLVLIHHTTHTYRNRTKVITSDIMRESKAFYHCARNSNAYSFAQRPSHSFRIHSLHTYNI